MKAPLLSPLWKRLAELLAVTFVYYGAARLGLLLSFEQTNASPVWPPSGIALAAVLLCGARVWPGILLGAFLANVVVFLSNQAAATATIFVISACISVGNTLEAVLGAFLLSRWVGMQSPLDRARDVFRFVLTTLLVCPVSCTIGALSLGTGGIAPWTAFGTIWFTWWLGDVTGILVLTPLLLTLCSLWEGHWHARHTLYAGLFLLLQLAAAQLVFGGQFLIGAPLAYTLIPFVIWAAFQFGARGIALTSLVLSGAAIWGTIHGRGPFVIGSLNESLLLLQVFVGTVTVTGLILGAVLTERLQAELGMAKARDDLARHAAQLEAANKELEAFAYSVSHDLRAPLRSIDGFSQILVEDYRDRLDEEGRQHLERVRAASQRMAQLIDDLLNLSRLTRAELHREEVDLSALARAIVADLRQRAPEREAEFIIADGLHADGDSRLLRVALQNLLENAWKFTGKKDHARIEFGVGRESETGVFFVRDNGAGFDMAYAGKLFGAFQRLHGVQEFPGTGIGLATVQRVLRRHGGRVWAEGAVEQGATFYFTLGS